MFSSFSSRVKAIKAFFSKSSATTTAPPRPESPTPTVTVERESSLRWLRKRKRVSTASAYTVPETTKFGYDDAWMVNVSPTVTLTENDTYSDLPPAQEPTRRRKPRPVSVSSVSDFIGSSLRTVAGSPVHDYDHETPVVHPTWVNRRSSGTSFGFFPVPRVPGGWASALHYSIMYPLILKDLYLVRLAASQQRAQHLSLRTHILSPIRRTPATFGVTHRAGQHRGIRIAPSSLPQNNPPSPADEEAIKPPAPPRELSVERRSRIVAYFDDVVPPMYTVNSVTQGHVNDEESRNKKDPQYQSALEGRDVRVHGDGSPLDAASAENGVKQLRPDDLGIGNMERVGFVEQVGSASATARMFERKERMKMFESARKLEKAMAGPKLGL